MFKSPIPLPSPLLGTIVLFTAMTTLFNGCSIFRETSVPLSPRQTSTVAMTQEDSQVARQLAELANLTHQQINEYRVSLELAPLELNAQISEQARIHSENMAQKTQKLSHDGFETRVKALKSDIAYRRAAENVAFNMGYHDPVSQAVTGWIKSDGHRQNMVGDYNLTGIGVAKNQQGEYYFTQIFILEN